MNRHWPKGEEFDQRIRDAMAAYAGPVRGAVRSIAEELGIPRYTLSQRLTQLGLTRPHRKEPGWTIAEDALLETLPIHNPKRAARIMAEHGYHRTPTAIVLRAKRRRLDRRSSHEGYSATRAAQIVGLDSKTIGQFCDTGRIVATRNEDARTVQQGGHRWEITPAALRDFVRANIEIIDLRRVDKLSFFALIDRPEAAPAPAEPEKPEPMKPGWTDEKRRLAYRRFGRIIIGLSEELNVPANELLTYVLKGDTPPARGAQGFADTAIPGAAPAGPTRVALPPPPPAVFDAAKRARLRELAGRAKAAEIARELGVSRTKVYEEAKAANLDLSIRRQWSLEFVAEIVRLETEEHLTKREICDRVGVTMYTLEAIARENGIRFTQRGKRPVLWDAARIARLRALAAEPGMTYDRLAERLGVTRNAIAGVCTREGIITGSQGGRRIAAARVRRLASTKPKGSNVPGAVAAVVRTPRPVPPVAGDDQLADLPVAAPRRAGNAGTVWVRLRHRDGKRWLRMDGLDWVERRSDGYIVNPEKLAAVRRAFPLARECEVIDEPTWRPRDFEFAQVIR